MHRQGAVIDCAARLIARIPKRHHITAVLKDLHWLRIADRITYKVLAIVYKAMNGLAPTYITELLEEHIPSRRLRSSSHRMLSVPAVRTVNYGDRSFSKAGPVLWNDLPNYINESPSLATFQKRLKTHLFNMAYNDA